MNYPSLSLKARLSLVLLLSLPAHAQSRTGYCAQPSRSIAIQTLVALSAPEPAEAAEARQLQKPNIIYLLADDLGSNDVGWRNPAIKTPNLDKLARAGATLDSYYVQPVCSPTRAAFLTGRYPIRYGLQTGVVRPWAQYGLPLAERTLPQGLKQSGYETAITGKWHLGHFKVPYLPTRRGFDHQYGHYNGALDYFTHIRDGGFDWHKDDAENYDEGYYTELIGKEAARLVRARNKTKPLFLYVPFNGVHGPHQVPSRYLGLYPDLKGERKTYAAMITALDDAVGTIVRAVNDENLAENTLIIFSSDNGGPNPGKLSDNGRLRAGKGSVYDGGVKVAAFATWPGKIKAGTSITTPIHIADWYPTLLKLTGSTVDQKFPLDGRDIFKVLTEGAPLPNREILINASPRAGAIRVGDWKLVVNGRSRISEDDSAGPEDTKARPEAELFNLAKDVSEKTDVSAAHPKKTRQLLERYRELARQAVPSKNEAKPRGFKSPAVWGQP